MTHSTCLNALDWDNAPAGTTHALVDDASGHVLGWIDANNGLVAFDALFNCEWVNMHHDFPRNTQQSWVVRPEPEQAPKQPSESTGGDNDYYLVHVTHSKRLGKYSAECEDIIRALGMTFDEGEAFKAIWRSAQIRNKGGKPGDSEIRNAQKVKHFGQGMELDAIRRAAM